MIDKLPNPYPPCPQCGENDWKFQTVPGHAELKISLIEVEYRLVWAAIGFAVVGLMMAYAPALYKFGYICLGAFFIVVPLIFRLRWLVRKIWAGMEVCQLCGFTAQAGDLPSKDALL